MSGEVTVSWPTCDQEDCNGVRIDSGQCLAHAEDHDLDGALAQISQTGNIDARGVTISSALLGQILDAVPRNSEGRQQFADARFDRATFQGDAVFLGAIFQGDAVFLGAIFQGDAVFVEATFQSVAGFDDATFQGDARFDRAIFRGNAFFFRAAICGDAQFIWATFQGDAGFFEATIQGYAGFGWATFGGVAVFSMATFQGYAHFGAATFQGYAGFDGVIFRGTAGFASAVFERAPDFGPLLAYRGLNLDGAQFSQPVVIEASTAGLCCRRARFAGGVQFRLRWARIVLDDTNLSVPSLLTGIPRLTDDKLAASEDRIARAWKRLHAGQISDQPTLLSLRRANVAGLGLSNVNLGECRFAGAHNLDLLRLEADVTLGLSLARAGWERRQVIAEEAAYRASRSRHGRWTAPQWPDWAGDHPALLDPGAVAGLYRALRKGREDAKDEPGAADFYYGEMEMRRHANSWANALEKASRGRVDRAVLTTYWLVSGYGLRAWRAFAALACVVAVFALAFHLTGFITPPHPASYWTSLLYAFRSTLSLSDDAVKLTSWGQLLQALLRLTGPVLLGLALLALRGRVKR
jgi:uncharacterized protein YjbI with pentapeptide repeats